MPKINQNDWYYIGKYINPPISCSIWNNWANAKSLYKVVNKKLNPNTLVLNGEYYVWQDNYNFLNQLAYQSIKNYDIKFYQNFFKVLAKINRDILNSSKKLQEKKSLTASDIKLIYKKNIELAGPWMIFTLMDRGAENALTEIFEKHNLSFKNFRHEFKSDGQLWMFKQNQEVIAFYQALKRKKLTRLLNNPNTFKSNLTKKDPQLLKKINQHLKKFGWFGIHHFWGSPLTLKKLINEIKQQANIKPTKNKKSRKKLPQEIRKRIKIINQLAYWRSRSAEVSAASSFFLRHQFVESTKHLGIKNYNQFIWFTFPEVIDHMQKNKKFNLPTIKIRKKSYGLCNLNNKEKSVTGLELKNLQNQLKITINTNIQEFKGTIANMGYAKGRVRIITEPKHVPGFKSGEILVAPETTPNFVPAMKKAAAIVTNHGGITCHAAIVSRELKKPCVIATKIGTHILKTGDLVEVDANHGIIKIL